MTENNPFVSRAHHVRTKYNSDITKAQFITGGGISINLSNKQPRQTAKRCLRRRTSRTVGDRQKWMHNSLRNRMHTSKDLARVWTRLSAVSHVHRKFYVSSCSSIGYVFCSRFGKFPRRGFICKGDGSHTWHDLHLKTESAKGVWTLTF